MRPCGNGTNVPMPLHAKLTASVPSVKLEQSQLANDPSYLVKSRFYSDHDDELHTCACKGRIVVYLYSYAFSKVKWFFCDWFCILFFLGVMNHADEMVISVNLLLWLFIPPGISHAIHNFSTLHFFITVQNVHEISYWLLKDIDIMVSTHYI